MIEAKIPKNGIFAPLVRGARSPLSPMAKILLNEAEVKTQIDEIVKKRTEQECSPEDGAKRDNQGKPQLSYMLDFPCAMGGLSKVMEFGARKYERNNWKKGQDPKGVVDSLLRHLASWQSGEVLDPESGENHLHHVVANALMLAELNS
jgi:hypothetical protein